MTFKNYSARYGGNGKKLINPKGNKPFWYHPKTGRFFDDKADIPALLKNETQYWISVLEFDVYQRILKIVSAENIKCQHVIELLPKSELFPKWTWNIDFCLDVHGKQVLIEAKGKWLLSDDVNRKCFIQTLRLMSDLQPEMFSSLLIVDHDNWIIPGTAIPVHSLDLLPQLVKMK